MRIYPALVRPLLFRFDPEWTHDRAIEAGGILGAIRATRSGLSALYTFHDSRLETEVCGIKFPNPIGLAAGFDKSGQAVDALTAVGFGHLEIGSVSAGRSEGNPRPRLFRLPRDRALVVHYGLQNDGADAIAARLASRRLPVPLGINIVKTNRGITAPAESTDEILDDYVRSVRTLKDAGDYLCLNLSCPNTAMGRDFFSDHGNTARLLSLLSELDVRCPVFLKVSPLGGVRAIEGLLEAVEGFALVSGFVFNLPPGKPDALLTPRRTVARMPGAVSGKPVEKLINKCIYEMYRRMDRSRYCIIGAGGVFSAKDAYRKIRLGASLVQLLTAMVYEGPGVVKGINRGLCQLLERDGFKNVAEAVGVESGT
jgi:dihydroorotate dehydrogenase (fumarate)/dihydroorotate dehydrogenase